MSNPSDNPLLHPPFFVIPGVDPNSPISAQTEQIDQLNTLLLQDIDANFARFHQIITSKVLPQIKRFAIASEPTREAAQFWRAFFETASAVRLSHQGDTTINSQPQDTSTQYDDQTLALRREADESSIRGEGSFMFDPPPGISSTPLPASRGAGSRPNNSWEDSMESPFDKLDRQLRDELRIGKSGYDEQSSSDMPTPSLPSGYDLPGMLGKDLSDLSSMHEDYSTGTVDPSHLSGSPTRSQTHSLSNPHQSQSLRYSTQASPTPKANRLANPPPADANPFGTKFSGIADLRSTPLNPNKGKGKGKGRVFKPKTSIIPGLDSDSDSDSDGGLPMGMSPPVTMNFTLPPRAQAMMDVAKAQTPAKAKAKGNPVDIGEHGRAGSQLAESVGAGAEAGYGVGSGAHAGKGKEKEAKHILDDLLEEMGSEMSPRMDTPEAFRRYSVAPGDLPAGKLLFTDPADIEEEQDETFHAPPSHHSYQPSHHSQAPFHSQQVDDDDTFHAPPSHHSYQPSAPSSHHSYQPPHPSYPRQSLADTSYNSSPDIPPSHAHPLSGQAPIYSGAEDSFDGDDTFDTDADISSFQVPSSVGSGHPGFAQPGQPGQGQYPGYQGGSGAGGAPGYTPPYGNMQGDESYVSSEGDVTDTSLFGGRGGREPGEGFNLMRQDEIHTYYGGGKLEDASLSQSPSEGLARGRSGGA
ncbi:hypothetical protein IAT38_003779 [Cryptococcus sp. DSM 104549]